MYIENAFKNDLYPLKKELSPPDDAVIRYRERTCCNRFFSFWYVIFKGFYLGIWFYWGGYAIIFWSYALPYKNGSHEVYKQPGYDLYKIAEKDVKENDAIAFPTFK